MRVCHVVYNEFPDDPRVRREVVTLANAGLGVDVLCTRSPGRPKAEDVLGIHVERLPVTVVRGGRLRYVYQYLLFVGLVFVVLAIRQSKFDYRVVHVHSLPDFLILAAIPARFMGATLILDLHESAPELMAARFKSRSLHPVYTILLWLQKLSCRLANYTVTVNAAIVERLRGRGVVRDRITIIENSPDWSEADARAGSTFVPGSLPEVIIAGGLNRERDYGTVIRAACIAAERRPFRLRIVGEGPLLYRQELVELVRSRGVSEWVSIEERVEPSEVRNLIRKTLFGVVSYERNPLTEIATPNKAYEYAACGKAMVVASLPALRNLLGACAIYYVPGDAQDLGLKMILLLTNSSERGRLESLITAAYKEHEWSVMATRLLDLYREGLGAGGAVALGSDSEQSARIGNLDRRLEGGTEQPADSLETRNRGVAERKCALVQDPKR